jgi:5'-3' exoribonuclease 1
MGIPGFYGQWLSKDVKQAVVNGIPNVVSSLAFDLNGVFHEARKAVFGEGEKDKRVQLALTQTKPEQLEIELHNAIAIIILRVVREVAPRDCVILAVDGVAPAGKMQQQRGRRAKAAQDRTPSDPFDGNSITPGTEFMMNLDNFMIRFIGKYRDYLPSKVLYSSHLVPGEGEHKIMDYYRAGEVINGDGAHIIYGLDADLIMLSLLAPINHVCLYRDRLTEVVNIDALKDYLLKRSGRPSAVDDFVLMTCLIGNDFLPHIPALSKLSESVSFLLDTYLSNPFVFTVRSGTEYIINWGHFLQFLSLVAEQEPTFLAYAAVRQVKYPSRFYQAAIQGGSFNMEDFRTLWYSNALGVKGPSSITQQIERITGRPVSPVSSDNVDTMCVKYMKTLAWVFLYYNKGTEAVNTAWSYTYYHSPLLNDLVATMQGYLNDAKTESESNLQNVLTDYEADPTIKPFTALHQLVAVLPRKSRNLAPPELQPLFSYNSMIYDYFPEDFLIERDGTNKDHEGIPIIPLVDRQRIIDAVGQISFTVERAKLWAPATSQTFERTAFEDGMLAHKVQSQRPPVMIDRQPSFRGRQQAGPVFVSRGSGRGGSQLPPPGRSQLPPPGRSQLPPPGRSQPAPPGPSFRGGRGGFVPPAPGRTQLPPPGNTQFPPPGRAQFPPPGRAQLPPPGRTQQYRPSRDDVNGTARRGGTPPFRGDLM